MKISVFGLGYVGVVSAACLASAGHDVIGVDPVASKVDMINQGQAPIIEKDIDEIIKSVCEKGKLSVTDNGGTAVEETRLSMICVGTPSKSNGDLDTRQIERVCLEIGQAIRNKTGHIVVIRSTILPGTTQNIIVPALEASSGKKAGKDFGICNNPEFLREGTAVYDFNHPPKTVIGETDTVSGDVVASLYEDLDAPLIRTDIKTAEMIKYTDNAWHALKVGFANEIGRVCKASGVDSHTVMDIFCKDTKLNISPYYLSPGFAFGGSCLPKDVRALTHKGKIMDLDLPILNAILPSNQVHIETGLQMILETGNRKIGFLGFSFKEGTDDLRESPVVELIERLLGKGYDIKIYDRNVNLSALLGANKDFILSRIPHIAKLMVSSMAEVLAHGRTIVIGNKSPEFRSPGYQKGQVIVDLVRAMEDRQTDSTYKGICW